MNTFEIRIEAIFWNTFGLFLKKHHLIGRLTIVTETHAFPQLAKQKVKVYQQ